MERKNLLTLDLQHFADEIENAGENEVEESATPQEEEMTEKVNEETGENEGDAAPTEQTAEENARYAAIRRRAEDEARRKYEAEINAMNQQVAAMCQGVTHPVTGRPITNVQEYMDALAIQQKQATEQELQEKGVDPQVINRMIAQNPVVMQAQQVIEQSQMNSAKYALQNDFAEVQKLDPSIKTIQDLANLPNFDEMLTLIDRNKLSLVAAYKLTNYGRSSDAARQQAINQMRGKEHLASQPTGVATENDDVEVPAEIMKSWKAEGRKEKDIRALYKKVAGQLGLN